MIASTRSAGRKDSSRRCVVSELPETEPLAEIDGDELGKERVEHFLGDRAHAHHGARQDLDLHLVEFFEDGTAEIGTEREQQHGGLLVAASGRAACASPPMTSWRTRALATGGAWILAAIS